MKMFKTSPPRRFSRKPFYPVRNNTPPRLLRGAGSRSGQFTRGSQYRAGISNGIYCLGFDPGIAITGYGVIARRDGITSCVDYGVIRTSQKLSSSKRLQILYQQVKKIISKYRPALIGLETIIFAKNVKTGIVVGEARGVILLAIAEAKINFIELSPLQVKQAVTSYGRADKSQIQFMVRRILKLKAVPRPDDAADALAIALAAEQMNGFRQTI